MIFKRDLYLERKKMIFEVSKLFEHTECIKFYNFFFISNSRWNILGIDIDHLLEEQVDHEYFTILGKRDKKLNPEYFRDHKNCNL